MATPGVPDRPCGSGMQSKQLGPFGVGAVSTWMLVALAGGRLLCRAEAAVIARAGRDLDGSRQRMDDRQQLDSSRRPTNTATFTNNGAPTAVNISANASIATMEFTAAAPAYSFTVRNGANFTIDNSGHQQLGTSCRLCGRYRLDADCRRQRGYLHRHARQRAIRRRHRGHRPDQPRRLPEHHPCHQHDLLRLVLGRGLSRAFQHLDDAHPHRRQQRRQHRHDRRRSHAVQLLRWRAHDRRRRPHRERHRPGRPRQRRHAVGGERRHAAGQRGSRWWPAPWSVSGTGSSVTVAGVTGFCIFGPATSPSATAARSTARAASRSMGSSIIASVHSDGRRIDLDHRRRAASPVGGRPAARACSPSPMAAR